MLCVFSRPENIIDSYRHIDGGGIFLELVMARDDTERRISEAVLDDLKEYTAYRIRCSATDGVILPCTVLGRFIDEISLERRMQCLIGHYRVQVGTYGTDDLLIEMCAVDGERRRQFPEPPEHAPCPLEIRIGIREDIPIAETLIISYSRAVCTALETYLREPDIIAEQSRRKPEHGGIRMFCSVCGHEYHPVRCLHRKRYAVEHRRIRYVLISSAFR